MAQAEKKAPKGVTKAGTPRQRAYRTYYALNSHGVMIRFGTYEERERAIKAGEVTRLTAHEARERSSLGEQAVSLAAARSVTPNKANPEPTVLRDSGHSQHTMSDPSISPSVDIRDLVQAQLLAEQAQATLATIVDKLAKLGKR